MNATTLIREKPLKPSSRTGPPQERVHAAGSPPIQTRAELATCTCPEHCERDHEND